MRKSSKIKRTSKVSPPEFPVRLNKYLAAHFPLTRRAADDLIKSGTVKINGRLAVLGDLVQASDKVETKSSASRPVYRYFAYHKPVGIATHSSSPTEKAIVNVLRLPVKAFPIGRLDKDSRGLILLTNDGRLAGALLSPDHEHTKEYVVTADKTVTAEQAKILANGIKIENYRTKKAQVTKTGDKEFTMILTEGKKHQVRRMCAALGLETRDLIRVRIENIKLGNLKVGEWRELAGPELAEFLITLKLNRN
ncbi:MAG: hypothetical protein A2571_01605 [Candidatus Vogelbacteria bacterium RIFOXYD1_FULL_44_32]|uniref:Pseudouridine synthase n=1 Tax=Candidatus Vogelbacteria bacterium RIFOXYD1_FULL_44_32 TaxID=1802438 RepID=A0A1G2QCZ7_9BACT|nr:MAG: hypothetical protein A2571_01605 [Candidatus Vogelbacteria bacterium RIFOXYD1_FULL_44_32]